jgi:hypothetical protein
VFFPKLGGQHQGQQETFVIKAKVSTLALSGLTPEQARQIAEAQGGSGDAGGAAPGPQPGGTAPAGK